MRDGSRKSLFVDTKDDEHNEEAFQASLKGRHYELFNIMDKNNPEKAREVFNSYFQLNKQIEVRSLQKFNPNLTVTAPFTNRILENSSRKS